MTVEAMMLAGALAGLLAAKLVLMATDYAPALARWRAGVKRGGACPALVQTS